MKTSTVVATCWSFESRIGTGWPSPTTVTPSGATMRDFWVNAPSPAHQRFIRQMRGQTGWFTACTKPSKMPISMNFPLRSWRTSSHSRLACRSGIIKRLLTFATMIAVPRPRVQRTLAPRPETGDLRRQERRTAPALPQTRRSPVIVSIHAPVKGATSRIIYCFSVSEFQSTRP